MTFPGSRRLWWCRGSRSTHLIIGGSCPYKIDIIRIIIYFKIIKCIQNKLKSMIHSEGFKLSNGSPQKILSSIFRQQWMENKHLKASLTQRWKCQLILHNKTRSHQKRSILTSISRYCPSRGKTFCRIIQKTQILMLLVHLLIKVKLNWF